METNKIVRGQLVSFDDKDGHNTLGILSAEYHVETLVEALQQAYYDVGYGVVTIQYIVSDRPVPIEEFELTVIKIMGRFDLEYSAKYSDLTGYLWTNEWAKIGNHDLLQELRNETGKYLDLRIHNTGK